MALSTVHELKTSLNELLDVPTETELKDIIADIDKSHDTNEAILCAPERYNLFPIQYQSIFDLYKRQQASFWVAEEIDFSQDKADFDTLKVTEQQFILKVLGFFAGSDGVVIKNLGSKFRDAMRVQEMILCYDFQCMMEGVHSEVYSLTIVTLEPNIQKQNTILHSASTDPTVAVKNEWALQWVRDDCSFASRVIAFCCVEGILFSGSFCAIYWLKKRNLMPGLCFSNELISRDEGLHVEFGVRTYSILARKLQDKTVHAIVSGAVRVEKEFITHALPVSLIGMNCKLMSQYIEFCADRLLIQLGHPVLYKVENPFPWMNMISLQGKTNFFEKRVGEYQKARVMSSANRILQGHHTVTDAFTTVDF